MNPQDDLVGRFTAQPDLEIRDSNAPTAEEVERQLVDHDDYQETEAHPDDDGPAAPVHEEFLGPPPPGVSVKDVEGGEALEREVAR